MLLIPPTTSEMTALLKKIHGLFTYRNTVIHNINVLKQCDYLVEKIRIHRNNRYYYDRRNFSMAELKISLDVVAFSRFITDKKSIELSDKFVNLASEYDSTLLELRLRLISRVESGNERASIWSTRSTGLSVRTRRSGSSSSIATATDGNSCGMMETRYIKSIRAGM